MWNTAFRFMLYDKAKLIGILFGIVISVFLIGAQLGLLDGLLDNSIGITKGNTDYVFVVNKKSTSANSLLNIDKRVGYELQSIQGVDKVYPVVVTQANSKYASGATAIACIIGIQSPDFIGGPKQYLPGTNLNELQNEGAVIVDQADIENMENIKVGDHFSINEVPVYVSGISINNANMGQGNIITSIERARKIGGMSANYVSAYLIKTNSNDPIENAKIAATITKNIPTIKAASGIDYKEETLEYVKKSSGIMISFIILVGFALVTGLIIVGLTIYSSVNDRIKDYGTIKAIGGTNKLITKLILLQSVLYAIIGFAFAMTLLYGLRYIMMAANQVMNFTTPVLLFLIFSTIIISVVGSYFPLKKIIKLEPVQIFRM